VYTWIVPGGWLARSAINRGVTVEIQYVIVSVADLRVWRSVTGELGMRSIVAYDVLCAIPWVGVGYRAGLVHAENVAVALAGATGGRVYLLESCGVDFKIIAEY
jgi:hypothetical protein